MKHPPKLRPTSRDYDHSVSQRFIRTPQKTNTFGFYALNGEYAVDFKEHSKKEDMCEFLYTMREKNPDKEIILDNFASHHAIKTKEISIRLVFLPPYSPDLNSIEFIWKSIKRVISRVLIQNEGRLKSPIKRKTQNSVLQKIN
jgi:hypothetical protein